MTVVRPNSIAGINSITVQTGQALNIHDASGNLIRNITSSTGISTFQSVEVTSGDLTVGISTLFVDKSTGRVGINTISPQSVLQVNDNNPVIAQIWRKNGGTDDQARIALGALSTNVPTQRGITLVAENNGAGHDFIVNTSSSHSAGPTEKLRVKSSGQVLIGTTTEGNVNADDLTVANSGEGGITIRSGSSSNGNIFFSDATSGAGEYAGIIDYKHSSNVMTFGTSGAEKLRIDSAGLIGIGTATPSVALDLVRSKVPSSDRNTDDAITIENNGTTNINIISATDNAGFILFSDDERAKGYMKYTHGSNILSFKTNGTEKLVIGSGGDLTLTGDEGTSSNLYLIADQGDDNGDGWRVGSNQDVNDLTLANNTSGSYVDKMRLSKEGYPTFPSLPAFSAKNSAGGDFTSGAQILYPNEDFDRNGDYTAASSYFTAPIAGIYFVSWSVKGTGSSNTTVYANCQVSTNDGGSWSQRGPALEFSSDIASEHTGMACVISLGADDRVRIGSATNARVDASDHFSICMLG